MVRLTVPGMPPSHQLPPLPSSRSLPPFSFPPAPAATLAYFSPATHQPASVRAAEEDAACRTPTARSQRRSCPSRPAPRAGCSAGVAAVSALISSSHVRLAAVQRAAPSRSPPPRRTPPTSSPCAVRESRKSVARCSSNAWKASSSSTSSPAPCPALSGALALVAEPLGQQRGAVGQVAWARAPGASDAAQLPVVELEPGETCGRSSTCTRMPARLEPPGQLARCRLDSCSAGLAAPDRHDHHLVRSELAAAGPGPCRRRGS